MLDLLISHAHVIDGAGSAGFPGSVGVVGSKIAWVGRDGSSDPDAAVVVDAAGSVVAPGFIDVHNHADLGVFADARFPNLVRQGITTIVAGNCGSSPWPTAGAPECAELVGMSPDAVDAKWKGFGDYLDAIEARRPALNVAALVGHGAVRLEVMASERRAPTGDELDSMRRLVADAMDGGALGLSTGLIYAPGIFAETDEVVTLAREAATRGGIYASHIRGEGEPLFDAVREAIEIGRSAELPAHVSHLKCETSFMHGRAEELLALLHAGDDVTGDQYPYTAWNSVLWSLLPPWAPVDEIGEVARRNRERLRNAVEDGEAGFQSSVRGVGWDAIVIEQTTDERCNGKSVAEIADARGTSPFDAFLDLLEEDPATLCTGHAMDEADVRTIAADPAVFVATDASVVSPDGPRGRSAVHPREYGTFPRVLARYVREQRELSLEAAIAKMTSLPADRFGLRDRGKIAEGAFADLVVLDPSTIGDAATFDAPHAFAEGFSHVIVNGSIAWDGRSYGEPAGAVLRRT